MVCCCDATAIPFVAKVWGEAFACFYTGTVKITVVCGIDCLACQDKFFIDVIENDENLLTLLFTCPTFFGLDEFELFQWEDYCFLSVIIVNPAFITSDNRGQEGGITRGNLMKLLSDGDTLLLLISCQKSHQARYTTLNKSM
jgi:hypothetical protein